MFNVLLPTYNEAGNIGIMVTMLRDVFAELSCAYKIIVVDDGSTDGTREIVEKLASTHPIAIIFRDRKLGLGTAYLAGLSQCTYAYTVIMDADLQHDPYSIVNMKKLLDSGTDIVTGTRYRGGCVAGRTFFRALVSCTANNLAHFILGTSVTDLTGSYRIYKTDLLKQIAPTIRCKGFGFQMETIVRAERRKATIAQFPIVFYDRNAGKSKFAFSELVYFLLTVLYLYVFS